MVGGIKVKVWMKIRMFEQILYDVVMFFLFECVIGMYITFDWRVFFLFNIIKQKVYKFIFRILLIGYIK